MKISPALITSFKAAAMIITLLVIAFTLMILAFYLGYWSDFARQKTHVQTLREKAAGGISPTVQEEVFFSTLPSDEATRLNQIQLVATHNSYHHQPDPVRLFFVGLVEPDEPEKMKYSHAPLYDQFDSGVRSIELDLRYKKNRFEVVHVPLVGNRGHVPDFRLALEEIRLWSDTHPGHIPIFVLLEIKSDMMALDPFLQDHSPASFRVLDDTIRSVIGRDKLLVPDDVRGSSESVQAALMSKGWPLLKDTLGKVIFILHKNDLYRRYYLSLSPNLEGLVMFTCGEAGDSDAAIVLRNDPSASDIPALVVAGYMVRTRADSDLTPLPERYNAALASGAQIISTDFPPAEPHEPTGYAVFFAGGGTIRRNPVIP